MDRRQFLNSILIGGVSSSLLSFNEKESIKKLTILHTNDTHSHIDAFPKNDRKYPNLGGVNARKLIIDKIRKEADHVLLFDAGDIFQGTPYFNMYGGEVEFKLMSALKYDAATMGNHDFDGGMDGFKAALKHANFPFICSNYDFNDTILNQQTVPFKIFKKGKLKIGVFGVGIKLDGLVSPNLFGNTKYLNPIKQAQYYADLLRHDHNCNLVICLSHLGYKPSVQMGDLKLAKMTNNIDLIIGGHTHTFLEKPEIHYNSNNKKVMINQAGWAGLKLGKIDFFFNENNDDRLWTHHSIENNISI